MGRLPPTTIYALARGAGFPPDVAVTMTAIALKESGGDPQAYNGLPPDDSYGLWQINMIDTPSYPLGAQRRAQWGLNSNDELFDPATNARAAYSIWGGDNRNLDVGWAIWRNAGEHARYTAQLPAAEAAATQVEGRDINPTRPPAARKKPGALRS